MKSFHRSTFAILYILCIGLAGCQSTTTDCQPAIYPGRIIDTPERFQLYFGPNIKVDQACTFTGRVTRGETYKHRITNDLVFCLLPRQFIKGEDSGWLMIISDTLDDDCGGDFVSIANPPFHGPSLQDIHGWQFRSDDNTRDDQSGLSGGYMRQFHFYMNKNDYRTAYSIISCSQWGIDCPTENSAKVDFTKIPRSVGFFTITDLELGNLIPNQKAWIEDMEFEVKIFLPSN